MYRVLIRQALNHFGYDVRRVPRASKLKIAGPEADPVTFEYDPLCRGHVVFEIFVSATRGFQGLALPFDCDIHPFKQAIARALGEDSAEDRRLSVQATLSTYYEHVCPTAAIDTVDLAETDAPGLRGVPAFSHLLPWSAQDVSEITRGRAKSIRLEGIQNGVLSSIEQGVTSFGPVDEAKLTLEVERLCGLIDSVRSRGFLPHQSESPMKVAALRRDGVNRWMIESGQHRFAMAAALGVAAVPAMVLRVIRREDAPYWPQVVNGTFTRKGAEKVFDRMFEGRPATVCNDWIAMSRRQDLDTADPPALAAGQSRGRD